MGGKHIITKILFKNVFSSIYSIVGYSVRMNLMHKFLLIAII